MKEHIINILTKYIDSLNFIDDDLKNISIRYIEFCVYNYYKTITNNNTFIKELKDVLFVVQTFNKETFEWKILKTITLDNINVRKGLIYFAIYISSTNFLDYKLIEAYQSAKPNLLKAVSVNLWNIKYIEKMNYLNSIYIAEYRNNDISSFRAFNINIDNLLIHDLLCEFITGNIEVLKLNKKFFELFDESVKDKSKSSTINSFKDFSIDIFREQFKFYDTLDLSNILCAFYLFLWGFEPEYDLFPKSSGITYKALKRKEFFKEYRTGYRLVIYNPLDPVPLFDKWIVDYNVFATNFLLVNNTNGKSINFELVNDKIYRQYVKTWLWKDSTISIKAKLDYFFYVNRFFNFISSNKKNDDINTISLEEAVSYKNYILNTIESDTNASKYLYNIQGVLSYLKDNNLMKIEDNVLYHLKYPSKSKNKAKTVPLEDLNKLAYLMDKNGENSTLNKLYYLIFYIILQTEFRISHILALETDCVEETAKKGQYIINTKTKTSNGFDIREGITSYLKEQIDYISKITQGLRNECREKKLKKRLFITTNYSRKLIISSIRIESFNDYLSECCKELGIAHYNASNLRDTHMTKAEEYIIRKGLSEIEQTALTGHTNTNTVNRHYVESNITEMLELVHGIIIGNVDINGKIITYADESIANSKNEVENGCGYCQCDSCKDNSCLSCFMCNDFVATVDRIPYFEEQLQIINHKITEATIPHDKEDLLNIKQLLLNYLKALYIKREEVKSNG